MPPGYSKCSPPRPTAKQEKTRTPVSVDVDGRKVDSSSPWLRFDPHVDSALCTLGGTVIESQA
jgi:hypothetical protein